MPLILLIKPSGEISLKTAFVRQFFTKKLRHNLKVALKKRAVPIEKLQTGQGRLYLFTPQPEKAQEVVKNVFGVHSCAVAMERSVETLEHLVKEALDFFSPELARAKSFSIKTRRLGSHAFSSRRVNEALGKALQQKFPFLKVDLRSPQKRLFVEVRQKKAFFYSSEEKGFGGLPVGVEGDVGLFVNGKKEELFAGFLMLKRGCRIFPIVSSPNKKLEEHVKKLERFNSFQGFFLTPKKGLKELIELKNLSALISCDTELKPKEFGEFDSKQVLPVFRPLAFFPKKEMLSLKKVLE